MREKRQKVSGVGLNAFSALNARSPAVTRPLPNRDDIRDDTPLRLDVAARLAFPDGSVGVSALRKERKRKRLRVWRIAGKDMTTLAEIKRMMDRCLVDDSQPDSGSDQQQRSEPPRGSSLTGDASSALAAARMRVKKLKESSPNTSARDTTPSQGGHVILMKSR